MPAPEARHATKDRAIIAMLLFFSLFNVTLDLYYVINASRLPEMVATDSLAWLWSIYAEADRFWIVTPWSWAQEAINVYVVTAVNLWLAWAIVKARPYRHALQLALGASLTYSVVLYFLAAHASGYAGMRERTVANFVLFYGITLPWLLGYLYMAWDSFAAITTRFSSTRPLTRQ
jgi:hypothetical protein